MILVDYLQNETQCSYVRFLYSPNFNDWNHHHLVFTFGRNDYIRCYCRIIKPSSLKYRLRFYVHPSLFDLFSSLNSVHLIGIVDLSGCFLFEAYFSSDTEIVNFLKQIICCSLLKDAHLDL